MHLQLPPNTPVIEIIRFAASIGCQARFRDGGFVFREQPDTATNVRVTRLPTMQVTSHE